MFRHSFSVQVLNCNFPITALDVSDDNAQTWQPTVRRDYNYFEKDGKAGVARDVVSIRVSCSNGREVIVPGVTLQERSLVTAPVNC